MGYLLRGVLWLGVYLGLVVTPVFVLLVSPSPPGRGFWWDFAMGLGFSAASMMGVMFVLTCRFQRASLPFGIDVIYYFHRAVSVAIVAALAGHACIPFLAAPGMAAWLRPSAMPWHLRAGVAATAALAALLVASFWRRRLRIDYDVWRPWHAVLAVAAVTLALVHMEGAGYYVDTPPKRFLWAFIGLCLVGLVLHVRVVKPASMLRRPYRLEEVRPEHGRAWTLVLRPVGHDSFSFLPGQFAWLTLGRSPFAMKEHPFSISSSAARRGEVWFTIKELGDFTRLVGTFRPGTVAYLDGPYGAFTLDRHDAPGYVFIAGGIGIAPVLSMLRTLADRRDHRPLLLIYAYGSWDELTCREELERLKDRLNLQLVLVLASPPENWPGETGFVTRDLLARYLPDHRGSRDYFVCGPVPMTRAVERILMQERVPLEKIHSELFDLV